jgi:large subunit ribosomal protein L9
MRVVLRSDLPNIGKRGDLVDVADGFARNFLIPGGKAIVASDGITAQAASMRRSRDLRDTKDREGAEAVAQKLVPLIISIPARAGRGGKLFGSVTTTDILTAVEEQSGIALDRHRLLAHDAIKDVGTHEVGVRLHPEVEFALTIEVTEA